MAKMYLVMGASGAGKTTFAKKFAKDNNLLYLAPDDFYAVINGDDRIRENKFEVWISLFQALHVAEINGINCVVDTNALTIIDRDQFLGWFPTFEHHLIYIEASPELRKKNNQQRLRQIPDSEMDKMTERLQVPCGETLDKRWATFTHMVNNNNEIGVNYHKSVVQL